MSNPMRQRFLLSALSAVLTATLLHAPAHAQTATAAAPVEEVTVTAERRTTDIQKTPLAITAISAGALQRSNVTQLADINGLVPSLQVTSSAGFETVVTLRGVGLETPENSLTTSPGVALYMDGAYVANSITLDQTLFDIDHVEVLRGPQGALYGESATGGAILLVTKQASLDGFGGDVSAGYGTYNLHQEEFDLNIPLTDTLAVHVAGQQFSHDGYDKDPLIPGYDPSNANSLIGKIDVLWTPATNLTFALSSESCHAYQNAAAQKNIDDPDPNPWEVTQDYPAKFNMATNLTHLNATWDTSWFTVKSVTTYQWLANVQGEDSSRSAFSLIGAYDDVAAWDTSLVNYNEELDFQSNTEGPFSWDAGLFLLSQFVAEFEGFAPPTPADLAILPVLQDNPNLAYGNISEVDRKSWAVFADVTYRFTNQLSATVGGRENADTYTDTSTNYSGAVFGGPSANTVVHSSSDHVPTFTAVFDYYPNPDNLLYVSANRGYKPGGVNGDNGQYLVPDAFKPEVNTAFEIGSKNSFLDDRLTADFAGFYYNYQDMQYIETDPVPFDGGISNVPSTHLWGGEAEFKYHGMDDHLHLDAAASLEGGAIQGNYFTIDSTIQQEIYATNPYCLEFFGNGKYFDSRCWAAVAAAAKNIGGNPPAKLVSRIASFDASYDFDIGCGLLTPGVQFIYRGGFWARDFDEPSLDRVPPYSLVNLSLVFVPENSAFKISLIASNVGNVAGVNSQYTDPYGTFTTSRQYIPPRQVVASLAYKF